MTLSVIFTTYNSPDWLEKVLWGYQCQTFKDFEVLVADDGSTAETAECIDHMRQSVHFPIRHIWQEDRGFRKCEILNKAIVASQTDYLVFSDGDCIPRADFLSVHSEKRRKGYFLSGGYFKLPMEISKAITKEDILSQSCFDIHWLRDKGMKQTFKDKKLTATQQQRKFLNKLTPTKATWNGHNASGWKADMLAVNGFDERMRYGAQDREFGERLMNSGIRGIQVRYSAICIHLDHSRSYVNEKDLKQNATIREITKRKKITRTPYGIIPDKHSEEE